MALTVWLVSLGVANLGGCSLLFSGGEDSATSDAGTPDAAPDADLRCGSRVCSPEESCVESHCSQCEKHADCDSGEVCDVIAGRCTVPDGLVIYVDPNRAPDCSAGFPSRCRSLSEASVLIDASPGENGQFVVALSPEVHSEPDANGFILRVLATVRILGFGADLAGSCRLSASAGSSLTVEGLALTQCAEETNTELVDCLESSELKLIEVTLAAAAPYNGGGIDADPCRNLVIERSRFSGFIGTALRIANALNFTVTNSVFVGNTGPAVDLAENLGGVFSFNTVFGNQPGTTTPGGVRCGQGMSSVLRGNIVWGENDPQVAANCPFEESVVRRDGVGNGNINQDPLLDEMTLRPTANSPGNDVPGLLGELPAGSLDYALRPRSNPPDMGALEEP